MTTRNGKGAAKPNQQSYNNGSLESIGNSQAVNPGQAESDLVFQRRGRYGMPNETFCNYQRQGSSPEESQLAFSTEVLWPVVAINIFSWLSFYKLT